MRALILRFQNETSYEILRTMAYAPHFSRVAFVICPTGRYCREDRCQSYFDIELIPSMRAPLEECQGAAGVLKGGGEAIIIDAPGEGLREGEFTSRLRAFSPDLIIVACTFGSLEADLGWVRKLKGEYPGGRIALRGAPCYVWGAELLRRCPELDLCLRGDYELVCEALVRSGLAAEGLTLRAEGDTIVERQELRAIDLDALPLPDRRTIATSKYTVRWTSQPQATVHVQRGCPFPCTFCLVHTVTGAQARHRSPDSIVAEIQSLQREGIHYFYLRAETFTVNRPWVLKLCNAIASRCPGVHWVTATRVECVDDEIIAAMKRAGCYGISFGVDVASAMIGERVRKRPNRDAAHRAMRLCDRHGIVSLAYIMIGFIWDTEATVAEAEDFICSIRPDLLTVHFAHPYPGTPYAEAVAAVGGKIVSLQAQATPALDLPGLSAKRLRSMARIMLFRHYLRSAVLWSLAKKGVARILPIRLSATTQPSAEAV